MQQNVQAIAVLREAECAAQLANPLRRALRPGALEVADELGSQQDEQKQSAHAFDSLHAHVFHIQALLLVETVAMCCLNNLMIQLAKKKGNFFKCFM